MAMLFILHITRPRIMNKTDRGRVSNNSNVTEHTSHTSEPWQRKITAKVELLNQLNPVLTNLLLARNARRGTSFLINGKCNIPDMWLHFLMVNIQMNLLAVYCLEQAYMLISEACLAEKCVKPLLANP